MTGWHVAAAAYLAFGVFTVLRVAREVIEADTAAQRAEPVWRQALVHLVTSLSLVLLWGPVYAVAIVVGIRDAWRGNWHG